MTDPPPEGASSGQQMVVCVVCGVQFLHFGPNRHGTTCSAACQGWLRLKNKGQESRAEPDEALWHERQRQIAEKVRKP